MLATIERAVKRIAPKRDPVADLARALEPVRELMRHWEQIEASHKAQTDVSKYVKYRDEVQARFDRTQSPRDEGELWLAGKMLENAEQQATEAKRVAYYGTLETEWFGTDSDAKAKIITAVAAKIEAAKAKLETVLASEQSRIGPDYNANESPIVKRQAGRVATWEHQLSLLTTRMILHDPVIEAQRFLSATKLLLENDENVQGSYRHNNDGEVYSLKMLPIENESEAEFAKPYELTSQRGVRRCNKEEFEEQFSRI